MYSEPIRVRPMQQSLHLENLTDPSVGQGERIALGKGLVLALENGLKGKAILYRGDYPIKSVALSDKVAKKLGSIWIPDSYVRRSSKRGLSRLLPQIRVLCTNSKKPRYKGSFSWEIPRWGHSQERNSDQNPSMVFDMNLVKPVTIVIARILYSPWL